MSPFDKIIDVYSSNIPVWQSAALGIAKELFILLVTIQIIWFGILWMMNRDDPTNLMLDFVKKMMVILFFWMVLINYEVWIPAIYNSLRDVGTYMTGSELLSPGDIMKRGIELSSLVMTAAKHGGFVEKIFGSILASAVGFSIFILFIRIGIEMVLILIGGKILLAGGIILLAFSGSKWTMQYSQRYFTAVISVGIKLLFITLLVGIGENQINGWAKILTDVKPDDLMEAYLSVLAAVFIYYYLCIKIPDLAVTMFTGSITFGFGNDVGSAMQAGASAATVGAVGASKVIGGMAQQAVGVGSAISQAVKVSSSQAKGSGIKSSISTIGKTLKTLGSVTAGMVKQGVSDSISKTAGGRMANQIRTLNAASPSIKDTNQSKM